MARGRPSRATVYARLDAAIAELRETLGGPPSREEAESIWADIWHLEAHHSTALEGNTLVLREVEQLLEQGRAVGAKPLREYMEVKGYAEAATWVYRQAMDPGDWTTGEIVSLQEVRHVHYLAMAPVWSVSPHEVASEREGPGQFREHDLHPFDAGMTPPTWPLLPARIADWLESTGLAAQGLVTGASQAPLPEVLARIHAEFERVHPFLDGNGRTGRLLLNLVLVRLAYPPVVIFKRQRPSYLTSLQRADGGEYGALGEILARAMHDSINRFIVSNVAGADQLVPLSALVSRDLSLPALRQAAQRGRLDARQGGDGVWRSSRSAVDAYRIGRNQRVKRPLEGEVR